jgi:hypothetical protein
MGRIERLGVAVMATTLAATLAVAAPNPAHADPGAEAPATSAAMQEEAEAFADAVISLEPSIVRADNGTLSLHTTAARAGVSQHAFNQVAASLAVVNRGVLKGELRTTADLGVQPAGFQALHNGLILHWWGQEVHFSAVWTNRIIAALNIGAGFATLAALITSALGGSGFVAAIVAAVLVIGAGILRFCAADGNGVKIFRPNVGPPWCTGH